MKYCLKLRQEKIDFMCPLHFKNEQKVHMKHENHRIEQ